MKKRSGFVSNSSSSSFIVAFDKRELSLSDGFPDEKTLESVLFPGIISYLHSGFGNEVVATPKQAAQEVLNQWNSDEKDIKEEIDSVIYDYIYDQATEGGYQSSSMPKLLKMSGYSWTEEDKVLIEESATLEKKQGSTWKLYSTLTPQELEAQRAQDQEDWRRQDQIREILSTRIMEKLLSREDIILKVFEFSDNNGSISSAMEHGNAFDNVDHIRISHH